MNIKKKLFIFVLSFVMIISLVPTVNVQAVTTDIKIISDTEVTAKDARKWAKSNGATETFMNLADLYWEYSSQCGDINPAIAYVQAAKETGYGKFGGVIDESYNNPCGLKTAEGGGNYDPNAHKRFDNWDEGVQAHLDHLALYAGASGYPKSDTYDPRHFRTIKGTATTVNALGGIGKWAPSATYGEEINKLYRDLLSYAGVADQEDNSDNQDKDNNKDDSNQSSNATPNPATPENKPSAPNSSVVIADVKPEIIDNTGDRNPNITSSIGWKQETGSWYYYKSDNTKAKGWIKPDSNWYYLNTDGKMLTGWLNLDGTWYYLKDSGIMAKGWIQLNNSWYFLNNSGAMLTGFVNDGSALYYFKDSGIMSTNSGWVTLNGKWYYSEPSGKIKTGWLKSGSSWYFLQANGSMVTGLNNINGINYYLNDNGSMKTGWTKINNYWYYFNTDGSMVKGWILDGSNYYYLYDTGAMAKGWINLNDSWYHLKDSGVMSKGWLSSGNDSYYLEPSTGRMLTNTTIDGCKIGTDGKKKTSSNTPSKPSENTNNNSSNNNKTIVIDPGHNYGGDYGAEGLISSESELDIQVAAKLKNELKNRGYNVIMTRDEGERPTLELNQSLAERVNIANNVNADLFVSIHHNSASAASASGVETYYSVAAKDPIYGGTLDSNRLIQSKKIATAIQNSIINKMNVKNRGTKSDSDRALFVLRNTNMPATLVEVGFITNPEEAKRCADSESQQKIAEAIAQAISENY